jgi:hypothetical protein
MYTFSLLVQSYIYKIEKYFLSLPRTFENFILI